MKNIVTLIRESFIEEAKHSPVLLNDLANLEKYIAESYDGRSLIELIQNADDAGATMFLIRPISENTYIVANNGRFFSENDVQALCRSGSSTKRRKTNTIGFRGIGFKSVVNYSSLVHLVSGEICLTFSREMTDRVVGVRNINIPLIRIPHDFVGSEYQGEIEKIISDGYNTVFVFEVSNPALLAEIERFDSSSMLFLKNIKEINFDFKNGKKSQITRQPLFKNAEIVSLVSNLCLDEWIVVNHFNGIEAVAFRTNEKKSIKASREESVVHSFMPTSEHLIIPCKLNGDFTTDPSRMRIILDENTMESIKNCTSVLCYILDYVIKNKKDDFNFIEVLNELRANSYDYTDRNGFNSHFKTSLIVSVHEYINSELNLQGENKLLLKPDWLSISDYDYLLSNSSIYGLQSELLNNVQSISNFLSNLNFGYFDTSSTLQAMEFREFEHYTRINLLAKMINENQYNMENKVKSLLLNSMIITTKNGLRKTSQIKVIDEIRDDFKFELVEKISGHSDLEFFVKNLGIKVPNVGAAKFKEEVYNTSNISSFNNEKIIPKWRSVEKNVSVLLVGYDNIVSIEDVSTQNRGYDLEATCSGGEKKYIEVKSVNDMGQQITLTTNEHSAATIFSNSYILAIVKQDDISIKVCIIKDPANTLRDNLVRRAKSWEYICNIYSGEVIESKMSNE